MLDKSSHKNQEEGEEKYQKEVSRRGMRMEIKEKITGKHPDALSLCIQSSCLVCLSLSKTVTVKKSFLTLFWQN